MKLKTLLRKAIKKTAKGLGKKIGEKVKKDIGKIKRETKSFAFFIKGDSYGHYN